MSKVCQICNKGRSTGHNVSHSKRHTKRTWHPNLITKKMEVDGTMQKIKICARCLKTLSKAPHKKPVKTAPPVTKAEKATTPTTDKPKENPTTKSEK